MSKTRHRIVVATAECFRARGYRGTSLKEVSEASGAPIGSVYHFFPGGKAELGAAVIEETGASYGALFALIADESDDLAEGLRRFFDGAATTLEESGYLDVCPIGTVASEVASTDEELRKAAGSVFASWEDLLVARLDAAGLPQRDAADLAVTVVAALQGGFVLARSRHDGELLRQAGRVVSDLVARHVAGLRASS